MLCALCLWHAARGAQRPVACHRHSAAYFGGAPRRPTAARKVPAKRWQDRANPEKTPHIVVDTLNLIHWLRQRRKRRAAPGAGPKRRREPRAGNAPEDRAPEDPAGPLTLPEIVRGIADTAPALRAVFPGRVMYVVKERDFLGDVDPADITPGMVTPRARAAYAQLAEDAGVWVYHIAQYAPLAEYAGRRGGPPDGDSHSLRGRDDYLAGLLAHRYQCAVASRDRFRDFGDLQVRVPPFHVYVYGPHGETERLYESPGALAASGRAVPRPTVVDFAGLLGALPKAGGVCTPSRAEKMAGGW